MLEQTTTPPLFPARSRPLFGISSAQSASSISWITGRESILAAQPLLAALASTTAQSGEADSLGYFLSTPDALRKTPWLLLIHSAGTLTEAVLLFEYRTAIGPSRVFATADDSGRRAVFALPARRARTAAFAARALIDRGAHIVHIAFAETHDDGLAPSEPIPGPGVAEQTIAAELRASPAHHPAQWALLERQIPSFLPLLPTFDATLARIGQKTRSNLRYYRRRAELGLGATFVPHATITREAFLAFNRDCAYAVSDSLAAFRFHTLSTQPAFCVRGIRDRDGRWLSLVGTRRQHRFVEIDWQMNRANLPAWSIATVLRSFLIEHEIALGSTRLYIEGGTPQPIGRSFLRQRIAELTLRRKSAYVRLLQRFAPMIFPPQNYVGQSLIDPTLHWRPC